MKDIKVQDAIDNSWVDRFAPMSWRPYLRLSRMDRPVGTWLLFLPCIFGAVLAGISADASFWSLAHVLIICGIGSLLMRGAGCTWNDIVDRKIDAQVERTKSRPLPSGQVSVKQALIWMIAQMVIAALGLLTFAWPVILLTLGSLVIVAAYPFAKRFTNWPQLVLGLCFNWGVLVAWMQITGEISMAGMALYIAMIFWTLFYDTIYALQDIEDDALIGVKSSAIALGENAATGLWIMLFGMGIFGVAAIFLGSGYDPKWLFVSFVGFTGAVGSQVRKIKGGNSKRFLKLFRMNVTDGQILAAVWMVIFLF